MAPAARWSGSITFGGMSTTDDASGPVTLSGREMRTLRHALNHALQTIPDAQRAENRDKVLALIHKLSRAEEDLGDRR